MKYKHRNPYKNYSDEPKAEPISQSRLKEVIEYNAVTGSFTWKVARRACKAGAPAGCTTPAGYHRICVDGRLYPAAHLAWLYTYGKWPPKWIDHRDGNPSNNSLTNLREALPAENAQNVGVSKRSASGYVGVAQAGGKNKWRAQIAVNGVNNHLGTFDTPEEAHQVYLEAKSRLHKFQPVPRPSKPTQP